MEVLVTGASGFIGNHLVKALQKEGYDVIPSSQTIDDKKGIKLDISDKKQLSKLPKSLDAVLHTAAFIPPKDSFTFFKKELYVNAGGTANLIEFCLKNNVEKFVYSSTISVYDNLIGDITEAHQITKTSFYGISKYIGEICCNVVPHVILRYSSVYGKGQRPNSVLPIFIQKARSGEDIVVFGDGNDTQDFVYIEDVVNANLKALNSRKSGAYNIGSGKPTKIKDLARLVSEIFSDGCAEVVFDRSKEVKRRQFRSNIQKAAKELGYKPKYTLRAGLLDYKNKLEKE